MRETWLPGIFVAKYADWIEIDTQNRYIHTYKMNSNDAQRINKPFPIEPSE